MGQGGISLRLRCWGIKCSVNQQLLIICVHGLGKLGGLYEMVSVNGHGRLVVLCVFIGGCIMCASALTVMIMLVEEQYCVISASGISQLRSMKKPTTDIRINEEKVKREIRKQLVSNNQLVVLCCCCLFACLCSYD